LRPSFVIKYWLWCVSLIIVCNLSNKDLLTHSEIRSRFKGIWCAADTKEEFVLAIISICHSQSPSILIFLIFIESAVVSVCVQFGCTETEHPQQPFSTLGTS
jgi:hypothetical protein